MIVWKFLGNTLPLFLIFQYFQIAGGSHIIHALGKPTNPLIHNLISSQQLCRIHIVFNKLTSENLEHTQNIGVRLTKLPTKNPISPEEFGGVSLNIFENRGWTCEVLIFYVTDDPKSTSKSIKEWLKVYTHHYVIEETRRWLDSPANGHLHFLILGKDNLPPSSILFDAHVPDRERTRLANNFGILYLPDNSSESVTLCVNFHFETNMPLKSENARHFHCDTIQSLPITEKSMESPEVEIWGIILIQNKGIETYHHDIDMHFFSLALTKVLGETLFVQRAISYYMKTGNFSVNSKHYRFKVNYPIFSGGYHATKDVDPLLQKIYISFEGRNYLSCYAESELSFKLYTNPFQWQVWVAVVVTIFIFTALTDTFVAKKLEKKETLSSLFFYFGAFLEETSSLPSDILNATVFRIGVGPWILLSSILSNIYVSLILLGLNAPPPPTHFKTWESLIQPSNSSCHNVKTILNYWDCFIKFATLEPDLNHKQFQGFSILSSPEFDTWEPNYYMYMRVLYKWSSAISQYSKMPKFEKTPIVSPMEKMFLSLASPEFRWYPKKMLSLLKSGDNISRVDIPSAIEEEIVECAKSVFFDTESEISRYHQHLQKKYPFISTYVGSNLIMKKFKYIEFSCPETSKILKYFKYFIESGIYNYYSLKYVRNKTASRNRNISDQIINKTFKSGKYWEPVKKLSLASSVNTLFIVVMVLIGIGCGIFAVENLISKDRRNSLRNRVGLIWAKIKYQTRLLHCCKC